MCSFGFYFIFKICGACRSKVQTFMKWMNGQKNFGSYVTGPKVDDSPRRKKDVDTIKMANGRQVGGINRSQFEDCFLESD